MLGMMIDFRVLIMEWLHFSVANDHIVYTLFIVWDDSHSIQASIKTVTLTECITNQMK